MRNFAPSENIWRKVFRYDPREKNVAMYSEYLPIPRLDRFCNYFLSVVDLFGRDVGTAKPRQFDVRGSTQLSNP